MARRCTHRCWGIVDSSSTAARCTMQGWTWRCHHVYVHHSPCLWPCSITHTTSLHDNQPNHQKLLDLSMQFLSTHVTPRHTPQCGYTIMCTYYATHCVHNVDKIRLEHIPGSPAWKAEECMVVFQRKKLMELLGRTEFRSKLHVDLYHLELELKQGSQCAHLNQSPTPSSDGNPRRRDPHALSDPGFLRPRRPQQPFSSIAHFAELLHDHHCRF